MKKFTNFGYPSQFFFAEIEDLFSFMFSSSVPIMCVDAARIINVKLVKLRNVRTSYHGNECWKEVTFIFLDK